MLQFSSHDLSPANFGIHELGHGQERCFDALSSEQHASLKPDKLSQSSKAIRVQKTVHAGPVASCLSAQPRCGGLACGLDIEAPIILVKPEKFRVHSLKYDKYGRG
jgi:hypothetical protein